MSNLSTRGNHDFAHKHVWLTIAENGVYHFQKFEGLCHVLKGCVIEV